MEFNPAGPPLWKEKPPITFFPHKDIVKYELGNWSKNAYEHF
jgi:hypothetical protein